MSRPWSSGPTNHTTVLANPAGAERPHFGSPMQMLDWIPGSLTRLVRDAVRRCGGDGGQVLALHSRRGGRRPSRDLTSWERLEERVLLASFSVPFVAQDILAAQHADWYEQGGTITAGNPVDFYTFTLPQAAGVFLDVDAQDIGLSSLDSLIRLYAGGTQIAMNDDGYDFESIEPTAGLFKDASLYADLAAGTYEVRMTRWGTSTGEYLLRILFDTGYTTAPPAFNSLPGSADTLYLDFNGHAATDAWGTYSALPFNFGGGPANTFSPGERLAIRNAWATVSEDFSPFNINVSTVEPALFADGVAQRMVITESPASIVNAGGAIGIAYSNSYASGGPSDQVGWVFSGAIGSFGAGASEGYSGRVVAGAIETGNTTSHEFGHALGLDHWASSAGGANGATVLPNAIMATPDTGLNRELWQVGSRNEEGIAQDDLAVIGSATNTFGFRTDDHGDTRATATALSTAGNRYTAAGVLSRLTDLDLFRFDASGSTTILVDVEESFNNLDVRIRLLNSSGNVVATSDPGDSFDARLTPTLSAGTYYLEVASHGDAGEVGQYRVQIDVPGLHNSPPVATPDAFLTTEDTSVSGNLITADNGSGVDRDPDGDAISLTAINGLAFVNGAPISLASGAVLTVQANGAFSYDPNGRFEALAVGASDSDSFTYTIADPFGNTASATVTLTIQGRNDPPTAADNAYLVSKGGTVSGNLITQDTGQGLDRDPDGDPLTLVKINSASVINGQVVTLPSAARLGLGSNGSFLYDPNGQFDGLTPSQTAQDTFTYTVSDPSGALATATVTVTISGQTAQVVIQGTTATVLGTDADDVFAFDAAAMTVTANGRVTSLPGTVTLVTLDGRQGNDRLTLLGTSGNDTAVLRPGVALLEFLPGHAGFDFSAVSVESITADGRGGTRDTLFLDDSSGDDVFTSRPGDATLSGPGHVNRGISFEIAAGRATAGGLDQAFLTDSGSDDVFSVTPAVANLNGNGFVSQASGFERVTADATAGFDRAFFQDSAGDDLFESAPGDARITGPQSFSLARGFDVVSARAGAGGIDTARIGDTPGNDLFVSRHNVSLLTGASLVEAVQFAVVSLRATRGGFDQAFLIDSPVDDVLTASSQSATMVGGGVTREAVGFKIVAGRSIVGGNDSAILFDTPGNDTASLSPGLTNVSGPDGLYLQALGFKAVSVRAVNGGTDRAFLFDSAGDDVLTASPTIARLTGSGYVSEAAGFGTVVARTSTGIDRANLSDSAGNDRLTADPLLATLQGTGFVLQAAGFDVVNVTASSGDDTARLTDSPGDDTFVAREFDGTLTGPGYTIFVTRFDVVDLAGTQGGVNRLDQRTLAYTINRIGSWQLV